MKRTINGILNWRDEEGSLFIRYTEAKKAWSQYLRGKEA
jgi:hypothetical protein